MSKCLGAVVAALAVILATGACRVPVSPPCYLSQFVRRDAPAVVVVTLDGVRWQDVFLGSDPRLGGGRHVPPRDLLPNLYRLFVDGGTVVGRDSPLLVSGRHHVSMPGYLELMRGVPATDCLTNLCSPQGVPTLLDYFSDVAVFASWAEIRRALGPDPEKFVVSAGRDFRTARWRDMGLSDDRLFHRDVGHLDYRPDRFTSAAVLDYLGRRVPQVLWVALGDTDERAHIDDYPGYLAALRAADDFIGYLVRRYEGRDVVFLVTTDHGRSDSWTHHGADVASARVWLMMRGRGVPVGRSVTSRVGLTLSSVLPTLLGLTHGVVSGSSLLR